MFLPAATIIASIFYNLILKVFQPQGEAYKFQFAENTNNFYKVKPTKVSKELPPGTVSKSLQVPEYNVHLCVHPLPMVISVLFWY
jgi:hypothetical protein